MTVSSITIVVFFLVYCASALSAGGQLFESVFGIDYHVALTIGALVVLVYTFLGGFTAVCVTDFIQGMLMLVGILAVPLFAYHSQVLNLPLLILVTMQIKFMKN